MAQYHDYVWWIEQFKGKFLVGKQKQRPAKSEDEARVFVSFYEKRGGGSAHWKLSMQKAFTEAYGKPYVAPEEYRIQKLEQREKELEAQIAAKEAELKAKAPEAPQLDTGKVMTKDEYKEYFAKELGYGSSANLSQPERLKFGRAWKTYAEKNGINDVSMVD